MYKVFSHIVPQYSCRIFILCAHFLKETNYVHVTYRVFDVECIAEYPNELLACTINLIPVSVQEALTSVKSHLLSQS